MENEKPLIVVTLPEDRAAPGVLAKIREHAPGWEVIPSPGKENFEEIFSEKILPRIRIIFGDAPFSLLARMPRLEWVQLWSAGADRLQKHPQTKSLPFLLTTTSGIHGPQMAEHLFGMILSYNRRLPEAFAAQKEKRWFRTGSGGIRFLGGKTLLIAGYGEIGKAVARVARSFGMTVIGVRRREIHKEEARNLPQSGGLILTGVSRIREFLPQADYVVNILPHTPETVHFFNSELFSLFKPGSVYASIGRGATTGEAALIEALGRFRPEAALLDVTEQEPLPGDSPLWEMEQVLLTGHYAGIHPDYDDLALEAALENLDRFLQGKPLKNLVDKEAGY
jgi:phosphoglycerate dehydrogenase-like enzyme